MLNYRYTDEDVRRSETLYLTAVKFLRQYQGDFPFLGTAKNFLIRNGELPVSTARGVLNAMRSNPEGAMMLPQTPTGRYEDDVGHSDSHVYTGNGHKRRPAYVDMKTTWRVQYALSTWPTAEVFHVIRPELSSVRWFPHTEQFQFHIELWCSYPMGWGPGARYILTNDKQGRRICKGCNRRMQAYA